MENNIVGQVKAKTPADDLILPQLSQTELLYWYATDERYSGPDLLVNALIHGLSIYPIDRAGFIQIAPTIPTSAAVAIFHVEHVTVEVPEMGATYYGPALFFLDESKKWIDGKNLNKQYRPTGQITFLDDAIAEATGTDN